MSLSPELAARIEKTVTSNRVVLFMKGNRRMPQCGFSSAVVGILDRFLPTYETVNILADAELRTGMKEYSKWPTFPQLYVDGKLVGGSDIVREMLGSGELAELLGIRSEMPEVLPEIGVTDGARAELGRHPFAPGEVLRFEVNAALRPRLELGPEEPSDVVVESNGVRLHLDLLTAQRASGFQIDFVPGAQGGFRITQGSPS